MVNFLTTKQNENPRIDDWIVKIGQSQFNQDILMTEPQKRKFPRRDSKGHSPPDSPPDSPNKRLKEPCLVHDYGHKFLQKFDAKNLEGSVNHWTLDDYSSLLEYFDVNYCGRKTKQMPSCCTSCHEVGMCLSHYEYKSSISSVEKTMLRKRRRWKARISHRDLQYLGKSCTKQ
jgi:hypothetical protein